jgi:hypothetical protein
MVTMAMVMGRLAMITDLATRLGVTTAAITAARTTKLTMKMLCAMFSPNTPPVSTGKECRRTSNATRNCFKTD